MNVMAMATKRRMRGNYAVNMLSMRAHSRRNGIAVSVGVSAIARFIEIHSSTTCQCLPIMSTNNFLMPFKSPDFSLTFTLALAAVVATHAGVYFGFFGAIVETG